MGVIGQIAVSPVGAYEIDSAQHPSGMIPMAMREHDALDDAEIEAELPGVALECVGLRPGVEQDRVRNAVAMRRDQARQAVIGAADALAGQNAHALAIKIGKLG